MTTLFSPLCCFLFLSSFCLLASKQYKQSYFSHVWAAHQDGRLVLKFIIRNYHNNAFWFPVEIMIVMCWQNNCTFIHGPDQWNCCSDVFKTILFAFLGPCLDCQTLFLSISDSEHKLRGSQCRTNHISFQFSWPSLPQKRRQIKLKQVGSLNFYFFTFIYFFIYFCISGHFSSNPGFWISSCLITL